MPTLKPFRDYDEKDVINLYAFSGSIPTNKGTLVKVAGEGFRNDLEPIEMLGNMGDFSVNNWVGQRYGVFPKVVEANPGDTPVGMLLFDVKELDENGMPLKYNPRKAAEMEVAISGQAVPIVTRGIFLYSGVVVSGGVPVTAGAPCYLGWHGVIATSGKTQHTLVSGTNGTVVGIDVKDAPIGKFLGSTGAPSGAGFADHSAVALVWLNLT